MKIKVDSESFFYRNMLTHRWLNFVLLAVLLITVFYFYFFIYMVIIFTYFSSFFGFLATIKIIVNGRKCDYAFSWMFLLLICFTTFYGKDIPRTVFWWNMMIGMLSACISLSFAFKKYYKI